MKLKLLIILSLCISELNSQNEISFLHLSPKTKNGYRTIKNITQDSNGYVWMSQANGLLQFDGYDYTFHSIDAIFNQINIDDEIENTIIDANNNLFVLTKNGLLTKREKNGNFTLLNKKLLRQESNILINKIFTIKNNIWVIDFNNVIYRLNTNSFEIDAAPMVPEVNLYGEEIVDLIILNENDIFFSTNKGRLFNLKNKRTHEIKGPYNNHPGIIYLTLSKNNDLWIGTQYMGLFKYDTLKKQIKQYSYFRNNIDILKKDMILTLFCDSEGSIWAGSDGEGLYKINPKTDNIQLFRHSSLNKSSLSTNSIIHINEDNNKNLWVISNYGDINILVKSNNKIFHHNGLKGNVSARVLSLLKDSKNNLWIGTDGKGLTKRNLITGTEKQFLTINNSLDGFYIQTITEDINNNIWVGTYKNGLWFYNSKKESISKITLPNDRGNEPMDVLTTFNDSKGRVWVASDIYLYLFNSRKEIIAKFKFGENNLNGELIRCIIEDNYGKIWLGVDNGGLYVFNETPNLKNSTFQNVNYGNNNRYNSIVSMAYDGDNKIWIVDLKGKIYFVNILDHTFKNYIGYKAVEGTIFHTVLLQNKNNLWLGSNNGLWNIDLKNGTSEQYTKVDGFFSDYYTRRCAFKDNAGVLYFGGLNGVDGFNPANITKKPIKPKLTINNIEILNKPASNLIPNQIKQGVEQTKSLNLKFNQSSFSFKFSAMGNILKTDYFYAYRLKGIYDDWVTTKNNRIASYTNIPPGKYTFQVKGTTSKGNWNIPLKSITITIAPPLWMHPFAYFTYILLFMLILFGIYKWYTLKKHLIQQKVKNEEEANSYYEKMNFFSKISHEIQTPLTLIMGPSKEIIERQESKNDHFLNQRLKVIYNNAKRLSRITNTLTTIRNKEIGQLKLQVSQNDIITKLRNISEAFLEEARFKKIDFNLDTFEDKYLFWFDDELLEHIIYNLLSNAFKYTPTHGKITIKIRQNIDDNKLNISIIDSGYGISKKEYNDIFKLFYRSTNSRYSKGMGIGLAFVKELVFLHKGNIYVKSKPNEKTVFKVSLPLNKNVYSNNEIITTTKNLTTKAVEQTPILNKTEYNTKDDKASILIVEDNYEMLNFLMDFFNKNFNVYGAYNGKEGLKLAKEFLPNIIISDIAMPGLDGLEMCKSLQNDKDTSHIPLIFLTAKPPGVYKLKGLKFGAIEFIKKPFDVNEIQLRVKNILSQNQKIYNKASLNHLSTPKETNKKSKDDEFIEKLISILKNNLDNPDFKLDSITEQMNMSYSNIYRTCQKITGKSIVDLLRVLRLKKAAILIIKNKYNISEACFAVGFNDTRYFSKCFKSQFKLTPSQFRKQAETMDLDRFLKKHNLV